MQIDAVRMKRRSNHQRRTMLTDEERRKADPREAPMPMDDDTGGSTFSSMHSPTLSSLSSMVDEYENSPPDLLDIP